MSGTRIDADPRVKVVMTGLDNPRGLAFGPEGALYVVEAGKGGSGPCVDHRNSTACYGASGAVTRLWHRSQEKVVRGLPSYILATGEVTGPQDIAFQPRGGAYITVGYGGDPTLRAGYGPAWTRFGALVRVDAERPGRDIDDEDFDWWKLLDRFSAPLARRWRVDTDVAAYEVAKNPAGLPVDSNPYGILAQQGARIVTDAGGNSLLRVSEDGDISTIAIFPSRGQGRATDAVPTSVVLGPDGAYYVSELSGAPFAAGASRVYRVLPCDVPQPLEGQAFTTVIDLAFGPDGSLYVLEHSTGPQFFAGAGDIVKISRDGKRRRVVYTGLTRPTSLLVDDDGTIYVTNNGIDVEKGEVLRIRL